MSHWNHRVVHSRQGIIGEPNEFEEVFEFAEVHYNKEGLPVSYGDPFMHSENLEGLRWVLEKLQVALEKPVLERAEIIRNDDK